MNGFVHLLLIVFIPIIVIMMIVWAIRTVIDNLVFTPENVSLKSRWVIKRFYDEAHYLIQRRYHRRGKPVFTKKGEYRANYMNDVNKLAHDIIHECCEGNRFSNDFCAFINESFPNIRRKELQSAIADYRKARREAIQNNMEEFINRSETITPEEFFEIKDRQKGDIVGVYIIHNESRDQYYVGQAKKLFFRINQHFTGHGNGDVYADYKYGDDFSIKIIKLSESGYDDIDLLEKDMIKRYDAFNIGYNRTSGNN